MADRQNIKQNAAEDSEELKRYLFFETGETERAQLEARFFDDDRLFYELLDLENDLTDRYARNELAEKDKNRFEASLKKSPERRAKLANAVALQTFIVEESTAAAPLTIEKESAGFWEKTADFFSFGAGKFQYATAGLLFLLLAGIGFLIYERQRDAQELARLRETENQRTAELQRQEQTLREQLITIAEREQNTQKELDGERGQTDILTEQLANEQAEKVRLIRELENLKRRKQLPAPLTALPIAPTIATVILAPIGGKGGGGGKIISISQNTATIAATLQIPAESAAETFSVNLNSAPLIVNRKPNQTRSGSKFIRVVFPAKSLSFAKENLISVTGSDGSRYNYVLRRQN